jgi:hypothetical protein
MSVKNGLSERVTSQTIRKKKLEKRNWKQIVKNLENNLFPDWAYQTGLKVSPTQTLHRGHVETFCPGS